jgi:hypothetical protein
MSWETMLRKSAVDSWVEASASRSVVSMRRRMAVDVDVIIRKAHQAHERMTRVPVKQLEPGRQPEGVSAVRGQVHTGATQAGCQSHK